MGSKVLPSSVAPVNAIEAQNVPFGTTTENVTQRGLIVGTALAAKAGTYVANVPKQIYSPDEVGSICGFGSGPHRAAIWFFAGSKGGAECWLAPQAEAGTGVAAAGSVEYTAVPTEAGTHHIRIAGESYAFDVTTDDTLTTLGDKLVAKMAATPECPVSGSNAVGVVTITCKSLGTYGNDVLITTNDLPGEETPAGLALTITALSSGANDADIDDVLTEMGTNDLANSDFFTKIVPCYGVLTTATMNSLSTYNGTGDVVEGCYSETVHRPFVAVFGDTVGDTAGLTAIRAIGDGRRELDRTNGAISVPGSPNHPCDIAAMAAGTMCSMGNVRPEETYVDQPMPGIIPGAKSDQWTSTYTNLDLACKSGVSPTKVKGTTVYMLNMLTFYHPLAIPLASNGYRSMRNVTLITNMNTHQYNVWEGVNWRGISIVEDVTTVGNMQSREKVRDNTSILLQLFEFADSFQDKAWIYSASWTKEKIGADVSTYISLRPGGLGWDYKIPVVFSGEKGLIVGQTQFDTNITVVAS